MKIGFVLQKIGILKEPKNKLFITSRNDYLSVRPKIFKAILFKNKLSQKVYIRIPTGVLHLPKMSLETCAKFLLTIT